MKIVQKDCTNKSDYFMRWVKYKNNKLVKNLINNDKIVDILCKDFSMCLNVDNKTIKICDNIHVLE